MAEVVTWEVWDSGQTARLGDAKGATPAEAYGDWARQTAALPSWQELDGSDEDVAKPGWFGVNLRDAAGLWWCFGGSVWQRTPDLAEVARYKATATEVTDAYFFVSPCPDPTFFDVERRKGLQWWTDNDLIASGQERLCRCIIHPECAGDATLARECWLANRAKLRRWSGHRHDAMVRESEAQFADEDTLRIRERRSFGR